VQEPLARQHQSQLLVPEETENNTAFLARQRIMPVVEEVLSTAQVLAEDKAEVVAVELRVLQERQIPVVVEEAPIQASPRPARAARVS
jgi:hypothetical protein